MTDEKNIVPQSNRGLLRNSDLIQRGVELARQFLARPARPRTEDILPGPFAWIEIPRGKTVLVYWNWESKSEVREVVEVEPFAIAKYPVTNAQFAKFIEAGGYRERKWWTEAGWEAREDFGWTKPLHWNYSEDNVADKPVAGVRWYEAIAFCLWLSDVTGENIMLPTEAQWQYAAQGNDGRIFPWGNDWDWKRCNHWWVNPYGGEGALPVTSYEGKGDSYFGVVDMAGNVWEWCLTDSENKTNDVTSEAELRVLRGGSWFDGESFRFRCDWRNEGPPYHANMDWGFRIARS